MKKPVLAWILLCVAAGTWLRFQGLERRTCWADEGVTLLRASGHTTGQLLERSAARGVDLDELRTYQRAPTDGKVSDVLHALIPEYTFHSPGFFGLTNAWMRASGGSLAAVRGLAAFFGVVLLPAAGWLAFEIFGSAAAAGVAIGLVSLSPLFVIYSQEARPYSLWMVLVCVSCASLLRALRTRKKRDWFAYFASSTLALYVFPLALLTLAGGLLFVFLERTVEWTTRRRALATAAAALLAFSPWLVVMFRASSRIARSLSDMEESLSIFSWAQRWLGGFSRLFIDLNQEEGASVLRALPTVGLSLAMSAAAGWFFFRKAERKPVRFVAALVLCNVLPILLPDLLWGGRRVIFIRYQLPACLMALFAVSWWLVRIGESARPAARRGAAAVLVLLTAAGFVSSLSLVSSETWWNKRMSPLELRRALSAYERPLLITGELPGPGTLGGVLCLAHGLSNRTEIRFASNPHSLESAGPRSSYDRIFLMNADVAEVSRAEKLFGVQFETIPMRGINLLASSGAAGHDRRN